MSYLVPQSETGSKLHILKVEISNRHHRNEESETDFALPFSHLLKTEASWSLLSKASGDYSGISAGNLSCGKHSGKVCLRTINWKYVTGVLDIYRSVGYFTCIQSSLSYINTAYSWPPFYRSLCMREIIAQRDIYVFCNCPINWTRQFKVLDYIFLLEYCFPSVGPSPLPFPLDFTLHWHFLSLPSRQPWRGVCQQAAWIYVVITLRCLDTNSCLILNLSVDVLSVHYSFCPLIWISNRKM